MILELRATAHGNLPPLKDLAQIQIDDFEIVSVEDQGNSVAEFETESQTTQIVCERLAMVTYQGRDDLAVLPETFTFPACDVEGAELEYQRFVDADLASVERQIQLEQQYGETENKWLPKTLIGAAIAIFLLVIGVMWSRRPRTEHIARFQIPEEMTPFTVLGLLRDIQKNSSIDNADNSNLSVQIEAIEQHYFKNANTPEPNLQDIAKNLGQKSLLNRTTQAPHQETGDNYHLA